MQIWFCRTSEWSSIDIFARANKEMSSSAPANRVQILLHRLLEHNTCRAPVEIFSTRILRMVCAEWYVNGDHFFTGSRCSSSLTGAVCRMIVSFPQLLELSQDKKEATVKFLENLGMPLHSVGKCLSQQPQLLGLSLEAKLQPTVNFLICECRIPSDRIGHLIATFPTILAYSIEGTLAPRLAFIREELNVPRHKVAPLLLKFPQLLGLSIETNMQPTIKYLTSEIGIPETEISKIIQQHPQILGLSVEANLKPKISFLLEEIGVPYERLARIVASFPTLLSLSIDSNLRPKVCSRCVSF